MARLSAALCALLVLACLIGATSALTCGQVDSDLAACLAYAKASGTPSPGCCSGVRTLANLAKTTPDRQTACTCLKKLVGQVSGINAGVVAGIPGKCGVNIPYPISMNTDCTKVK